MTDTVQPTPRARRRPEPDESEILRLDQVFRRGFGGIPVLLLLAFALSLATDAFLTGTNLDNLGRQVSIYAIIAVGQLLVILTAGIDLSVGSVVGLAGVIAATAVIETTGALPVLWSVLLVGMKVVGWGDSGLSVRFSDGVSRSRQWRISAASSRAWMAWPCRSATCARLSAKPCCQARLG